MATTPTTKDRKQLFQFRNEWILDYGLSIGCRDSKTSEVISVRCRFCDFGREEGEGTRKRKKTNHIKFFKAPWRSDNITRHLNENHSEQYKEYKKLNAKKK